MTTRKTVIVERPDALLANCYRCRSSAERSGQRRLLTLIPIEFESGFSVVAASRNRQSKNKN